jgi:hypothetical protein
VIAVDTNVLVYASRTDSPHNAAAFNAMAALVAGDEPWAIPWPCVHEYLAVLTNGRLFPDPTPSSVALDQVDEFARAGASFLGERSGHLRRLRDAVEGMNATGARIHDAKIAAICVAHGVRELWTLDRDFANVPGLRTRNPLEDLPNEEGPSRTGDGPSSPE